MVIKILGTGCPRCKKLEEQVKKIIKENNITAEVIKVTELNEMIEYGIMATPGLVINEKLKSSGVLPKDEQILNWIKEEMK
ncbi:MAG: thioredoxin family protein [Ignavibacteria bacterium]|nr:thioredoxin family protein [Ignavibacteria bacterium]